MYLRIITIQNRNCRQFRNCVSQPHVRRMKHPSPDVIPVDLPVPTSGAELVHNGGVMEVSQPGAPTYGGAAQREAPEP